MGNISWTGHAGVSLQNESKGKQAGVSEMGWKGCFQRKIHWKVKTTMQEECCDDIWSHKHYLFYVQVSTHQLSEVKRPPEKAVWQRKLLAAFLCRECQGHSINLQPSAFPLVFLRLLRLLLGEWHCINIFYSPSFFITERKTAKIKTLHRGVLIWRWALIFPWQQPGLWLMYCLGMPEHPMVSVWKMHFQGEDWSGHQGKVPACRDEAVSGLSHGR